MKLALSFTFATVVGALVLTGCSKKPCGPATAPGYAQDFVLSGGQVCKASDGGGGVTLSINYQGVDESGLQTMYKTELGAKGYKVDGSNGIYFASKGKSANNMITTLKDKDRGGATAVVKVFP